MTTPQPLAWPVTTPGLVVLPSGRGVVGCAGRALAGLDPQLVVALHRGRIPGVADVLRVDWPDFRTPRDAVDAVATLGAAYEAASQAQVPSGHLFLAERSLFAHRAVTVWHVRRKV